MAPRTVEEALQLLETLGAGPWLVRHHALVVEAGRGLLEALPQACLAHVDRDAVLLGCALHDAGKLLHPAEQHAPGHAHEQAGRALLEARGVPAAISRFCVTHAVWSGSSAPEDLLVALADKLWKGRREEALEELLVRKLAAASGLSFWEAWPELAAAFEQVAEGADDRLARSRV